MTPTQTDAQKALEDWIDAGTKHAVDLWALKHHAAIEAALEHFAHPPAPCPVGDDETAWRNWVAAQGGNIAADDQCSWESFKAGYEAGAVVTQPEDGDAEALRAFNALIGAANVALSESSNPADQHAFKAFDFLAEKVRRALAAQCIDDTQSLEKMRVSEPNYLLNKYDPAWCIGHQYGWNACLDAIIERRKTDAS